MTPLQLSIKKRNELGKTCIDMTVDSCLSIGCGYIENGRCVLRGYLEDRGDIVDGKLVKRGVTNE